MFYSNSDMMRWIIKHKQDLRRSLDGEPSPDTLNAWSLEDQRDSFLLNMYLEEEAHAAREASAPEDFNVKITSEVRVK